MLICSHFEIIGNLYHTMALTSHGRGRWFDPSIAPSYPAAALRHVRFRRRIEYPRHPPNQVASAVRIQAMRRSAPAKRAPRVGFEVEATLGGDGRVNVEGDIGYCGAVSDEELVVA